VELHKYNDVGDEADGDYCYCELLLVYFRICVIFVMFIVI